MVSLETLPAPLPLHIVYRLDLKSLYAVRLSSPLFAAHFGLHATEIFEHVMVQSLCRDVIVDLRAYVLLLTRRHKTLTNEELQDLYSAAQEPLPRDTPTSVIGHTLHIFAKLSNVCQAVFDQKLQRLYSLPHQHLADVSKASHIGDRPYDLHLQPGQEYTLPPPSPPDWEEQQRLFRAIWRLQMWRTLGNSDSNSMPSRDFPAFTWDAEKPISSQILLDEIEEMAASLSVSAVEIPKEVIWGSLATKPVVESTIQRQKAMRDLIFPPCESWGYGWFNKACARWPHSPLRDADWKIMRHLGFGIWSSRRLRELRLKSRDKPFRNLRQRLQQQQLLEQPEPTQEGEDLDTRDVLFTWNVLYRTAAGEDVRTSNAHDKVSDDTA